MRSASFDSGLLGNHSLTSSLNGGGIISCRVTSLLVHNYLKLKASVRLHATFAVIYGDFVGVPDDLNRVSVQVKAVGCVALATSLTLCEAQSWLWV